MNKEQTGTMDGYIVDAPLLTSGFMRVDQWSLMMIPSKPPTKIMSIDA